MAGLFAQLPRTAASARLLLAALLGAAPMSIASARGARQAVVAFDQSPFPFEGMVPGATPADPGRPFLQSDPDGRRFHLSPRGGKLYEETYGSKDSLLVIPPGFDPTRPDARIVVFFHGNLATLRDVEGRQGVPRQLAASHLNAALVAPQLAVNALDSSAGHFYEPGFFDRYVHEAAERLAILSRGRFTAAQLDALPVVLVAYSGGYVPTAYTLATDDPRIAGVVLLDALFGEETKFEDWVRRRHAQAFFVSAYSKASAPLDAQLETNLTEAGVSVLSSLPEAVGPGTIVFRASLDAVHNDFVTRAWTADPLAAILSRVRAGAR